MRTAAFRAGIRFSDAVAGPRLRDTPLLDAWLVRAATDEAG